MATNEHVEKLKEYIRLLELHTPRYDLDNPTHVKLRNEIGVLESQAKEPSDHDIENASVDYVDEENNHFAKQAKKAAYQQGAKDMRDGNIYISPKSQNQIKG